MVEAGVREAIELIKNFDYVPTFNYGWDIIFFDQYNLFLWLVE